MKKTFGLLVLLALFTSCSRQSYSELSSGKANEAVMPTYGHGLLPDVKTDTFSSLSNLIKNVTPDSVIKPDVPKLNFWQKGKLRIAKKIIKSNLAKQFPLESFHFTKEQLNDDPHISDGDIGILFLYVLALLLIIGLVVFLLSLLLGRTGAIIVAIGLGLILLLFSSHSG